MSESTAFEVYNENSRALLVRNINSFEDSYYSMQVPHRKFGIQLSDSTIVDTTEYPLVDCLNYTIPTSEQSGVKIASSSAVDTGCFVFVIYLDNQYREQYEMVVLNGTTPVTMAAINLFRFVNAFVVSNATGQETNQLYRNNGKVFWGKGAYNVSTGFAENYAAMRVGLNVCGSPLVCVKQNERHQIISIKYNNMSSKNINFKVYMRPSSSAPFVFVNEQTVLPYTCFVADQRIGQTLDNPGTEFIHIAKLVGVGGPLSGEVSVQMSSRIFNASYYAPAPF